MQVCGSTSYASVVQTFDTKAKHADPVLEKDWNKNLGILFTFSKNIPKYIFTHTLIEYEIPANIKSHTLNVLAGLQQTAVVKTLTDQYKIVLANEHSLNQLCHGLSNRIKNDLKASNSILNEDKYIDWEKKSMQKLHVHKVIRHLGDMKFDFLKFHTKFTTQLNEAYEAKAAFIRASSLVPNIIKKQKDKMDVLSIFMRDYKNIQAQVHTHLERAWNISCEYILKRDEWVDFLIGE